MKTIALVTVALGLFPAPERPASNKTVSDPAGIYARLDRVVLLPDDQKPERVELQGAFAIADGGSGDYYRAPRWGRMVLGAPDGSRDECITIWRDLVTVAGTGQIVAFSSRYEQRDVSVCCDAAAEPKLGVMAAGWELRKVQSANWGPAQSLRMLARPLGPLGQGPAAPERAPRNGMPVEFAFGNAPGQDAETRYVVVVECDGESFASPLLPPGDGETTKWTVSLALTAGQSVRWSVHTVHPKLERTPIASAAFVAGKAPTKER